MTYLKTALISSAVALAASTTAYADGHKDKSTNMQIMTKTTVTTQTQGLTMTNDTVGEILQADGQPDTQSDYELLTHDGDMLTKAEAKTLDSDHEIANNAIVVPSSTGAVTTVNCPIGTTAQPDMTCHVTGNFSLERTDNLLAQENADEMEVKGAVAYTSQTDDEAVSATNAYKGTLRSEDYIDMTSK
ncbi:hypothetical protein GCM10011309_11820 [Litorimonas cladophorae]|uniref:Uncharacterized protein n=1 Tax=Litorimonas cladophorae TaxID=1220491 RepID=A0A918KH19_9PROT|nr:hypothetical protein [Litorimonas cladophorae]GGX63467.1 hypothetical protein GCM10011309_11820 [Litorimonas cladophorae]